MPLDPGRLADTAAWLAKARQDLKAATVLLAASPALPGAAAFHCQQATEKSFKAFLAWHDQAFRKTHSLEELGRQLTVLDRALEPLVNRSVALTEYAWKFRYPGEPAEATREEADACAEARARGLRQHPGPPACRGAAVTTVATRAGRLPLTPLGRAGT